MTANTPEYQSAYYRRTKAEKHRKEVERCRRKAAEARSFKAAFKAEEERRAQRREAEAAARRREQYALSRLLQTPLFGGSSAPC
jgi:hypothetical protein